MDSINTVVHMIQNEDFNLISQMVTVNNENVNTILDDESEDDIDDLTEEYEIEEGTSLQVPSTYTTLEETNFNIDDNWMASLSESKCDFSRELGKDSFKDKYELTRAVKLYTIKAHKHFEVVESRPTTRFIRCMLHNQGCKWQVRAHGFHRYCLRHFINNFNDKFHNSELKTLAYRAGSQNQIRKFNLVMEEIGKINPQARQWLEGHRLDRWTLAHDGGKRYGLLTTNLSEIFNSVLKGARFLPITACVQLTFYRLVHYYDVRRPMGSNAQANGDMFTPHVVAKQAALMSKASAHFLRSFDRNKGLFEVITQKGRNVQVVNLDQWSCTCGKWEIFKYPCSHVLSVCAKLSLNSWQYIHTCYSIEDYCATWSSQFFPLPHEAYWPKSSSIKKLLPNLEAIRDKKGRPRSTRLRNGMDIKEGKRRKNNCGICGQPGHNRATCPSKPKRFDA